MKPFPRSRIISLIVVIVFPLLACITHSAWNIAFPQTGPTPVRATVERGGTMLVIRLPPDRESRQTDITFFDRDAAPAKTVRAVAIGPAAGTATSPNDYKRKELSTQEQEAIIQLRNQWCSSTPALAEERSNKPQYEIGVSCGGFRIKHFFFSTTNVPVELIALADIANYNLIDAQTE